MPTQVCLDEPQTAPSSLGQLNLLVVFDALMKERNVTRAGRVLGLSQSAVSNALAQLREILGDRLFVRVRNEMVPSSRALAGVTIRVIPLRAPDDVEGLTDSEVDLCIGLPPNDDARMQSCSHQGRLDVRTRLPGNRFDAGEISRASHVSIEDSWGGHLTWHSRMQRDPAFPWLRGLLQHVSTEHQRGSEAQRGPTWSAAWCVQL